MFINVQQYLKCNKIHLTFYRRDVHMYLPSQQGQNVYYIGFYNPDFYLGQNILLWTPNFTQSRIFSAYLGHNITLWTQYVTKNTAFC
jgi:hypothetical protein